MTAKKPKARNSPRFQKGTLDHDGNGKKGGSKPAPKPVRDAADQALFDLGRHARRGGIRREDCPLSGKDAGFWLDGWDFQDGA